MRRSPLVVLVLLALGALVAPLLAISSGAVAAAPGAPPAAAAAGKAAVRSTIIQTMTGFRGRLTSDRAGCVRRRDIYVIVGNGDGYPMPFYVATTDNTGRWSVDGGRLARRAGGTTYYTAFTLGDRDCRIAQSPTISSTAMRGTASRARKAAVSITLAGSGPAQEDFSGRITSKRSACERFRPVFVFVRPAGSDEPFQTQLFSISRANGAWRGGQDGSMSRGVDPFDVLVAVPGNRRCSPAQSATKRVTA